MMRSTTTSRITLLFLVAFLSSLPPAFAAEESPAVLVREYIYETAPFPSCHASTIEQTLNTS